MIFPFAPSIVVDGGIVHSYLAPYIRAGHVMAPLDPFVTRVAASIEYSGGMLIVRRADRFVQIAMRQPLPSQYKTTYVEIAPLLRTLGVAVTYDATERRLIVRTPSPVLATPTPFNPAVPYVLPHPVFTPTPLPTPRPTFSGTPSPRRTPIPYGSPAPQETPPA
jgi:hypothetical protein